MLMNATLFQKIIAIALIYLTILLLSPPKIRALFIVLGYGHFIASYLYQYRAKKMNGVFLVSYLISAGIVFAWIASGISSLDTIILVAGSFFIIHQFYDEIRLFNLQALPAHIALLLPAGFGYFSILLNATTHLIHPVLFGVYTLLAGIACGIYAYKKSTQPRHRFFLLYMSLLTAAACLLLLFDVAVLPVVIFGLLILYHYSEWYLYYAFRFWHNRSRFRNYVGEMVAINVFIIILYLLFLSSASWNAPLSILFAPAYFYGWSILHIIASWAALSIRPPHPSQV